MLVLLLRPFLALFDDLEVIVQDRRNHRHHIRFHDSPSYSLRASHADVHDALKSKVPLPHLHHILTPPLLENTYQPLDAAIDGEYVSYAARRCRQICQVIERVDER